MDFATFSGLADYVVELSKGGKRATVGERRQRKNGWYVKTADGWKKEKASPAGDVKTKSRGSARSRDSDAAQKVNAHVERLNRHIGRVAFDRVFAEVAEHPPAHVHAVAKAFTGTKGQSKERSLDIILRHHQRVGGIGAEGWDERRRD